MTTGSRIDVNDEQSPGSSIASDVEEEVAKGEVKGESCTVDRPIDNHEDPCVSWEYTRQGHEMRK
ncbi:hypothetical protein K0M31_017246 [Melipona bicolor]|uniref:Uncharacterized protein n=1 Tax=Melipona bicolor TaxID=60889 RepID=A0AA40G4Q2_9HYME|nr:hypothetical protein K0M31_017246 [Melipona bicolor]